MPNSDTDKEDNVKTNKQKNYTEYESREKTGQVSYAQEGELEPI